MIPDNVLMKLCPDIYIYICVYILFILFTFIPKSTFSLTNKSFDVDIVAPHPFLTEKVNIPETSILENQLEEPKKAETELYDEKFRLQKENGEVKKVIDFPIYFRNASKDKLPQEGNTISVWVTSLSQSINPGWVIILTPLVVAFFTYLRSRKKEPSTPTKIAFGLLISALSVLVMVAAVHIGNNGTEKVSVWWLVANYGVITIGELFLSPMGLSVVSKLSPKNITALMMGGWFLSTSIGNKLSGVLASMWDTYEDKTDFFWINFSLLMFATVLMFVLLKQLNKVMQEKGIN
jgi:POT family proton-dependent oligopeptide transporter